MRQLVAHLPYLVITLVLLLGITFFCTLGYLTTQGYLGPDECRLGLILSIFTSYLLHQAPVNSKLTKTQEPLRFCNTRSSGPKFWDDSLPTRRRRKRRRYPKQYWLRRRIARREPPPEGDFLPWDHTECEAHNQPHLSNPRILYGQSFDDFLSTIDPTLPVQLMKADFISTTKVKEKADRNATAFVAATYLQGDGGTDLNKFAYWGEKSELITPIVIDTGASISISGLKEDFINGIDPLDPDTKIQGLNHAVQVSGIGTVR